MSLPKNHFWTQLCIYIYIEELSPKMIFGKLTNKKSSTNVSFGAFIRRKKETTKFDYKCFNLRRDIIRSVGNIEIYNIYTTKT